LAQLLDSFMEGGDIQRRSVIRQEPAFKIHLLPG
jgi:hypothetical protein